LETQPLIRILFLIISSLGLLMALGTVLARNLVHAALFLIGFFFIIACQYVLLEAEFLAVIQVLIYIGAVAILLLFGIMLTRNIQGDETTTVRWPTRLPATIAGLGVLVVLAYGIGGQTGRQYQPSWTALTTRQPATLPSGPGATVLRSEAISDMGRVVGYEMMTRYVVPFEVAGLLLTAALVGAIALAQLEGANEPQKARPGTLTHPGSTPTNGGPSNLPPLAATTAHSPSSEPR
jgi:NADH:ubiquinone oxidoreductase subunit 6 (subunit J)